MALFVVLWVLSLFVSSKAEPKFFNVVDLTWSFDNNSINWPDNRPFTFTKRINRVRDDGSWYASDDFCTGEHVGTHLDAPYHFNQNGWRVDEIPIDRLIVPGASIDISKEVDLLGANARLRVEHLQNWEKRYGPFPQNSVLLIRYGWSKYYLNYDDYMGVDRTNGSFNFPGMSKAAADYIVNMGKIVGIAVDTTSGDPGSSTVGYVHKTLLSQSIYIVENVNIPPYIPAKNFALLVMPMKIRGGSAAPVRIMAVLN